MKREGLVGGLEDNKRRASVLAFLEGMAAVLDMGAVSPPPKPKVSRVVGDAEAWEADWRLVGSDLAAALGQFRLSA